MAKKPTSTEAATDTDALAEVPSDEAQQSATPANPGEVSVTANGCFHRDGNFQGPLVAHGDVFSTTRMRAAELRANGLVTFNDEPGEPA